MSEGTSAVKEVQDFIQKNKPDLIMTNVPIATLREFKEFANSELFRCTNNTGGHYGFALKFLLDFYKSCNAVSIMEVNEKVDYALEKIAENQKEPEKEIRLLNGKKITKVN